MAEPNFQSRTLYHGDNLDFLRGMNSETVHLVATDPPFNKNRDFHATPDSLASGARFKDRWRWDDDVHEEWTDSIRDDWPAVESMIAGARLTYGDDMGAFLCWMGVRLMEMRRVLRADGSIYLHCDPTASHYLKALMDAIFGWKNFRNEIIWHYRRWTAASRHFQRMHDVLLRYTKSDDFIFNLQYEPYGDWIEKDYGYVDEETGKRWRWHTVKGKRYKVFLEDKDRGVKLNDVWTIPYLGSTAKERTGYPTQKPLALYERIIKASSSEGDIVLDPFCGCATTPIAAERLKRKWIGMDIWDGAYTQVMERLERDTILRFDDKSHVTLPQVHYSTEPPRRTDDNELAAPSLKLKTPRAVEPWEKLRHRQMVKVLELAQRSNGNVICAGCGRELEREFMELDHITPRTDGGENHIRNRILLCRPCNGRKGQYLTLSGLLRENKKVGWMKDDSLAQLAREHAREKAEWVRGYFHTQECQELIRG
ncbi:MAG: DNA methyltransferase [Chloroflexi bacterium]|nr:DNA methyltransferase [Chloroflexota bacterium]